MEKLSISKVIINVFYIPWLNRRFYSLVLAAPILLLVCIWSVWVVLSPAYQAVNYLIYFFYLVSFSYLAITCHKLILVEKASLANAIKTNPGSLLRFLLLMGAVYLTDIIIHAVILNLYVFIFDHVLYSGISGEALKERNMPDRVDIEVVQYISYLPAMYIMSRLCLVFPAIALGFTTGFKWSWNATRENHLHIFFIVALFPYALKLILYLLYRQNVTIIEQALIALLTYITAVLGVFAVSLTYKELHAIEQRRH
jgi:hypothetical protein